MEFLEQMCTCLRPQPFAIHERLVKPSEYGMNFIILLSGKLRVLRCVISRASESTSAAREMMADPLLIYVAQAWRATWCQWLAS